jgi:hypothetical protein
MAAFAARNTELRASGTAPIQGWGAWHPPGRRLLLTERPLDEEAYCLGSLLEEGVPPSVMTALASPDEPDLL